MSLSAKRKWRSSEEIALQFLEQQGFKIIDKHVKVKIEGVEVSEIDAIVENEKGEKYAVEIKAGTIDVNGIRQAYVNAQLVGYKPLIVAKGFADDSAAALADKLGIKVYQLKDYYLVEAEELETLVKASINNIIQELLDILLTEKKLSPEEYDFLEEMATTKTIKELADKHNTTINDVARKIRRLQKKGVLSYKHKNYQYLRLEAQLLVLRENIRRIINKINLILDQINSSLKTMKN